VCVRPQGRVWAEGFTPIVPGLPGRSRRTLEGKAGPHARLGLQNRAAVQVSLSNYRCTPSATKPNYAPNSGLREGLHRLYGDRLRGILVYGSFARGEAGGDSDVDVLVVLDGIEGYAAEVDRTGELVSCLSLKYGVSISRAFVEERD